MFKLKKKCVNRFAGFFSTSLMICCFTVCTSTVETNEKWISNVENLMWLNPDSALAVLNLVDSLALDKYHKSVYTLLYTQALDKTNGDITQRVEVFGLKDYFEREGYLNYAALAAFYKGRIFFERKDDAHALSAFLAANAFEDRINDDRLRGLIRLNLGILNYREPNYSEAVYNLQKAYEFFCLAGETVYQARTLLLTGKSYLLDGNAQKSLEYYEKAFDICRKNRIEQFQPEIIQNMGVIYLSTGNYQKANNLLIQAHSLFSNEKMRMITSLNLAKLYAKNGILDTARYYVKKAAQLFEKAKNPHAMVNAYYILTTIEEKDGNFELALKYHKQYADSLFKIKDKENELKMFQIREEHHANLLKKKNEILARNLWIGGLTAILIIIFIISFFYWRSVQLKEKARKAIEDLKIMAESYNEKEITIKNLVLQHFDIMRKVFILQIREKNRGTDPDLMIKFNKLIYNTEEMDWNTLYRKITKLCDHLMIGMKQVFELKRLNEDDFKIFCLDYAGFQQQEASILLKMSMSKIQKRMAAIRDKFGAGKKDDIFEIVRQKASDITKSAQK